MRERYQLITESQKAVLVNSIETNIEWRYPTESGTTQYDFNPSGNIFIFRSGEPVSKELPGVRMRFLPRTAMVVGGINNLWYVDENGWPIYGYGELEPVIITVYTDQQCRGTLGIYHGKIVADTYIRSIERYIRRYWPRLLWDMDAKIKENISFTVEDISEFYQGTEKQGFEMVLYIVSTNKWDHIPESGDTGIRSFKDATFSGQTAGEEGWDSVFSVSGYMTR